MAVKEVEEPKLRETKEESIRTQCMACGSLIITNGKTFAEHKKQVAKHRQEDCISGDM